MKYGTSKYSTIKYGIYTLLRKVSNIRAISARFRLRSRNFSYISMSLECPLARKIRVNSVVGILLELPRPVSKVRLIAPKSRYIVVSKEI